MTPPPAFVALVLRAERAVAPSRIVGLDCGLAEDRRTVVFYYRPERSEWWSLSYTLPAPMNRKRFHSWDYIDAARALLDRPAGTTVH